MNHDALAHEWLYDLMTRPDMSIKVGLQSHDMRILGRIVKVRSTKQPVRHHAKARHYLIKLLRCIDPANRMIHRSFFHFI